MLYEDDSDIEPRKGPQAIINAELTERLLSYDYVEDLTAWATVSGMENNPRLLERLRQMRSKLSANEVSRYLSLSLSFGHLSVTVR